MIRTGGREAGLPAARRHAKVFDGLLGSLFHAVKATQGRALEISLGAVGSYGRGGVAFASDLDVRILSGNASAEAAGPFAEAMLYPLWDTGLAVGHQVFTADEVIELARDRSAHLDEPSGLARRGRRRASSPRASRIECSKA